MATALEKKVENEQPEADKPIEANSPAADFLNGYLDRHTKKKDKEGSEGKPKESEEQKPPVKPKARTVTPKAAAPVIDEEKLGEAIGRSITQATGEKPGKKATGKEGDTETDELFASPREQRKLKVFEQMAESNSERYSGLAEKYKTAKRKFAEYAKKWEEENPGEKFDEDAEEHNETRDQLEAEIDYDEDDFDEAKVKLALSGTIEEATKPLKEKLSKFEQREKLQAEAPKIIRARDDAGNFFWKQMDERFKDVVDEKGRINLEVLDKLKAEDEDVYTEALNAVQAVETYAAEMYMLGNRLVAFDKNNPVHQKLSAFALAAEQDMLKASRDKQIDSEGRQFVTLKKYTAMTPEEQADYWTYTPEDLNELMAQEIAKVAQAKINQIEEKFQRRAKARGLDVGDVKPRVASARQTKTVEELEAEREEEDDKPKSPESGASPRLATARGKPAEKAKSAAETWVQEAIG